MDMKSFRKLGKRGHKKTVQCPLDDCNYKSRVMIVAEMDNKISNHSENCPKHQLKLIDLPYVGKIRKIERKNKNN
jgi:hypothetical protein